MVARFRASLAANYSTPPMSLSNLARTGKGYSLIDLEGLVRRVHTRVAAPGWEMAELARRVVG